MMSTKIISKNRNHPNAKPDTSGETNEDVKAQGEQAETEDGGIEVEVHPVKHAKRQTQKAKPATDADEVEQLLKRILKISGPADNPGMAYRNLETIRALAESLSKKLGFEIEPQTPHQRPKN